MAYELEFVNPYYEVKVDGELVLVKNYKIVSVRDFPADTAEIEMDVLFLAEKGVKIEIWLGYREQQKWLVFQGVVNDISNTGETRKLFCRDHIIKLQNTKDKVTLMNVTPQKVVKYALSKAGINKYELSKANHQVRKQFPINQKDDMVEIIKKVNKAWGLDYPFYFQPDGTFYWGEKKVVEADIPVFEYGVNIISMEMDEENTSKRRLKTISLPFLKHSMLIKILHPEVDKEYFVINKVIHYTDSGFPRTEIYFEPEGYHKNLEPQKEKAAKGKKKNGRSKTSGKCTKKDHAKVL